jgi:putative endonuclease
MFYIYFLYSKSGDKYYVGSTENYHQRLEEHNSSDRITWTSKYRPWILAAVFECGENRGAAIKIEKFIKKQKSRKLIEQIIAGENLYGILAQLQRVPVFRS